MTKKIICLIILILALFSGLQNLHAQIVKYSNEFLSIGVGARALAMGNANVAVSDNTSSSYWNPAGLVRLQKKFEIDLMHADYFAGIAKYDYFGFGYRINESSALAASVIRLGVDDIQNTLDLIDDQGNMDWDRVTLFSVADYAAFFSYAKISKIDGLTFGASAKLIYRHQGDFANAYGFGLDMGIQYYKNNWYLAAFGKDITSTFNAWFFNTSELEDVFLETGNEIPENSIEVTMPRLIAGVARDFSIGNKFGITPEIDIDCTFDGQRNVLVSSKVINIDPHAGIEFNFRKAVYLRTGLNNFYLIPDLNKKVLNLQPSLGLGLHLFNFRLDYALTTMGDLSNALYSNIFSLSYSFDWGK